MTLQELQMLMMQRKAAVRTGCGDTSGNREPIRIPFDIFIPTPGNGVQDPSYRAFAMAAPQFGPATESSASIWCPALVHKTVEIFAAPGDLAAAPIFIQAAIAGSDLLQPDWYTLTAPIVAPGIYPIAAAAASAIPFMFEPEVTLLRIIGDFDDGAGFTGVIPRSLVAIFAGIWFGEGAWCMRCVNSYSGH